MKIQNIFDSWYEKDAADASDVKSTWMELASYLYDNCSDADVETILTYVLNFTHAAEQEAYRAGFCAAFTLWLDIERRTK